jgi:hypothetical protein
MKIVIQKNPVGGVQFFADNGADVTATFLPGLQAVEIEARAGSLTHARLSYALVEVEAFIDGDEIERADESAGDSAA